MSVRDRSRLPTRTPSSRSYRDDSAPSDAARSDDVAITDVYKSVEETGSLEAAAKKLQQYAVTQAWEDDPEEAAYIAQTRNTDIEDGKFEDDVVMDDDDYDYEGQDQLQEVIHLQEIIPGLWVGDLVAAMDAPGLEERGIRNILSLLRPSLQFAPTFAVYPVEIDDSPETDILTHLPSCVAWIHEALEKRLRATDPEYSARIDPMPPRENIIDHKAPETKPGAVLVHCQAGMSRSATVAAAYVMQVLEIGPVEAVELLLEKRPVVDPSPAFWYQLGLFYNADGRVSLRDRQTRQFYMERSTSSFMNGDGGAPDMDMMAKYPATPTASRPATPAGGHGRRKIRCKACRRHLAVREHLMDHILDQAPLSRPLTPSNVPLASPRPSMSHGSGFPTADDTKEPPARRPSVISEVINPLTGLPGATTRSRHGSTASLQMTALTPSMTPVHDENDPTSREASPSSPGGLSPVPSPGGLPYPRSSNAAHPLPGPSNLKPPAASPAGDVPSPAPHPLAQPPMVASQSLSAQSSADNMAPGPRPLLTAEQLNSRLPPHLQALRTRKTSMSELNSPFTNSPASSPERETPPPSTTTVRPTENTRKASLPVVNPLSAVANPTGAGLGRSRSQSSAAGAPRAAVPGGATGGLAGRRMSSLAMTSADGSFPSRRGSGASEAGPSTPVGPPILVNPKCSGYFVEPLTWMEPFLSNGDISGKITCPNEKCGVKLGNFDWAGVQCGCKEWVTPGFCIARSKVDEVW